MGTPILYTDTDAIRASIGIDEHDYSDGAMIASNLQLELELELDEWVPNHLSIAQAAREEAPTVSETTQWKLLTLFSQWYCAGLVSDRVLALNKVVADGKNRGERFEVDLAKVRELALSKAANYKEKLMGAITVGYQSSSQFTFAVASTPSIDPITEVPD